MNSSSNKKFLLSGNGARVFNHAAECIDSGTTFPQQFHHQHAASNLTDTQHRALFSGEELAWCGAGDAVPGLKFLDCEVALILAGLS